MAYSSGYAPSSIGIPVPAIPPPELGNYVYEVPVSPDPSPTASRAPSRTRRGTTGERGPLVTYEGREKHYYDHLGVRAGGMARSSSTGGYRGRMEVGEARPDRPRSLYNDHNRRYPEDEFRGRSKSYYGNGGYPDSLYSSSSRGSREHSRGPPYGRRRSPSCDTCDGHDYQAPYPPGHGNPAWPPALIGAPPAPPPAAGGGVMTIFDPRPQQQQLQLENKADPELQKKIADLQKQLEASKLESEKIKKAKEVEEEAARRKAEIQKEVQFEIEKRKAAEEAAKAAAEAEKRRIDEAARLQAMKLYEAQKRAEEEAKKKAEEAVKAQKAAEETAALKAQVEKMKLDLTKPTYTKFSKQHLCKEALDERKISYTEQADSFLVHRWVDHEEQKVLWARTKEIRAYQLEYQQQFKEAADKAPIIQTATGPVKIVRVGNHPPVTVPVVMVTKKANSEPEPVKFRHIFGMR